MRKIVNRKFNYHNVEELQKDCQINNINLNFSNNINVLNRSLKVGNRKLPNRLAIQPMEGYDSDNKGGPGELTFRRYKRFAKGGAGLLWFEATAILKEGRSNPYQLILNESTKLGFSELLKMTKETAMNEYGSDHEPFCVLQLTHSGRFSKPYGQRKPLIAVHDSVFDRAVHIDKDYPLLTDEELKYIQEHFIKAAKLAYNVGFDAVDIKSCHRYLISELLGTRNRNGKYGGTYENRTRFLKETIEIIRKEILNLIIAVRLNASDVVRSENAWGVKKIGNENEIEIDLDEPKKLVKELKELGLSLLNITAGTPYLNPHINRPYDRPVKGGYNELEHPLHGVQRLFKLSGEIQKAVPDLPVVGSGYSWLRQFGGAAAAANVENGQHALVGFGRQAFAYPNFARDLLEKGIMEPRKCCITCSRCSQLMIYGTKTGCVIHDSEIYAPIFKKATKI